MNWFKNILFCLAMTVGVITFSQQLLADAQEAYVAGNLELARQKLDLFFEDTLNENSIEGYYFKGYVYKDMYKKSPVDDSDFTWRMTSIESFKKAYDLDTGQVYRMDIQKNIKFLVLNFYNEGILRTVSMDLDAHRFIENKITPYEEYTGLSDNVLGEVKYEFMMAKGDAYIKQSELPSNAKQKASLLDSAEIVYLDVLKNNPRDYDANYHLGLVYYNQAVDVINTYDGFVTIEQLQEIEDQTNDLFKKALPYMDTAFEQNSSNVNVIEALGGIHFSLKNFEKSEEYMGMLK